jgi:branched-chain amino acid transport system substrate-binding protein
MRYYWHLPQLLLAIALIGGCQKRLQPLEDRAPGVRPDEVLIGMTAANSGSAAFLGTETNVGVLTWLNEVNSKGGINGRRLKLVFRDDGYDPPRTAANVQTLLADDRVFALIGFVGTPTSVKAMSLIERSRVPAVGFFTGAETLRNPMKTWAFHIRDSYYSETEEAIAHFVDRLKLTRIAVLYQEDAFGQAVLSGVQLALQRRKMQPIATASFVRGSMAQEEPLKRLQTSMPEAYVMVGTYGPLARFVKLACDSGHHPWFHTVSFVGSEAYAHEIVETQKVDRIEYSHILVTQVVPSPLGDEYPGVVEFRRQLAQYFPKEVPNYVAFEGFVDAHVLTVGLQRAGAKLDRDRLLVALESIVALDIGIGQTISYTKDKHVGLAGVFLSRLSDDATFRTFRP